MITDKNESHCVYIKDFNRFIRQKIRIRNAFKKWKYCLQCFINKIVLIEHKETCLKVNDKQTVKSKAVSINFKNYFKHLAMSFKIYV